MNSIPLDPDFPDTLSDGEFASDSQERHSPAKRGGTKNTSWKSAIPEMVPNVKSDAVAVVDSKRELNRCQSVSVNEMQLQDMDVEEAQETRRKIVRSVELIGERLYAMRERKGYAALGFKSFKAFFLDVCEETGKSERSLWRVLAETTAKKQPRIEAKKANPRLIAEYKPSVEDATQEIVESSFKEETESSSEEPKEFLNLPIVHPAPAKTVLILPLHMEAETQTIGAEETIYLTPDTSNNPQELLKAKEEVWKALERLMTAVSRDFWESPSEAETLYNAWKAYEEARNG